MNMTDFSPEAQKILNYCNSAVERLPLTAKPEQFSVVLITAALSAIADETVPVKYELVDGHLQYEKQNPIREKILAIAAELNNGFNLGENN